MLKGSNRKWFSIQKSIPTLSILFGSKILKLQTCQDSESSLLIYPSWKITSKIKWVKNLLQEKLSKRKENKGKERRWKKRRKKKEKKASSLDPANSDSHPGEQRANLELILLQLVYRVTCRNESKWRPTRRREETEQRVHSELWNLADWGTYSGKARVHQKSR